VGVFKTFSLSVSKAVHRGSRAFCTIFQFLMEKKGPAFMGGPILWKVGKIDD
jgi:hypothetical protein